MFFIGISDLIFGCKKLLRKKNVVINDCQLTHRYKRWAEEGKERGFCHKHYSIPSGLMKTRFPVSRNRATISSAIGVTASPTFSMGLNEMSVVVFFWKG